MEENNGLKTLLDYYDDMYYNQNSSSISDAEYDALKKKYLEQTGKEEYDYVPGEAQNDFEKFEHWTNVLSLDKVQITEIDKIKKHLERLWPVVIQPKMDGLTLVTYPNGVHVTRGNGVVGEIVTQNANKSQGLGIVLTTPIRSEVVMLHSEFDKINIEREKQGLEPFENCRNTAAGMLRNLDSSKVRGLKAFAYNYLYTDPMDYSENSKQIELLKKLNWNTVDSYEPTDIDDAMEYIMNYDRNTLDYDIDGLVIKSNSLRDFGETGHHRRDSVAIKFEAEGDWTQLLDITYQVGKTGKITPVAEVAPVKIMGSTITRATLHNGAIMKALGLTHIFIDKNNKTFVKIIKANDVIPKIVDVRHENPDGMHSYIKNIIEPERCPDCGEPTEYKNDLLYCVNDNCESQIAGKIELLASREALDIEGLSEATVEKMLDLYEESDLSEKYAPPMTLPFFFDYEEILNLPGFAEVSAKKLYNNIQKAKTPKLKNFIYAANIPLIGKSASEDIANYVINLDGLLKEVENCYTGIATIKDIGPTMIENLKKYGEIRIVSLLAADINPIAVEKKKVKVQSNQLTIVITGAFEIPRKEIENMIKESGHKTSGSVSRKTSYLLASPGEESTTKYLNAIELGVNIIHTLDELKDMLGE
jgi:DNA ligase (NAD+)